VRCVVQASRAWSVSRVRRETPATRGWSASTDSRDCQACAAQQVRWAGQATPGRRVSRAGAARRGLTAARAVAAPTVCLVATERRASLVLLASLVFLETEEPSDSLDSRVVMDLPDLQVRVRAGIYASAHPTDRTRGHYVYALCVRLCVCSCVAGMMHSATSMPP